MFSRPFPSEKTTTTYNSYCVTEACWFRQSLFWKKLPPSFACMHMAFQLLDERTTCMSNLKENHIVMISFYTSSFFNHFTKRTRVIHKYFALYTGAVFAGDIWYKCQKQKWVKLPSKWLITLKIPDCIDYWWFYFFRNSLWSFDHS